MKLTVLIHYTDLSNPLTFRDLSKPIGALNEERLAFFKVRPSSTVAEERERKRVTSVNICCVFV